MAFVDSALRNRKSPINPRAVDFALRNRKVLKKPSPINPRAVDYALRHPNLPKKPSPVQPRAVDYALRHPDVIPLPKPLIKPLPKPKPKLKPKPKPIPEIEDIEDIPTPDPGFIPDPRLAELRAERLRAALEAIGADFDLQEGDLNKQLAQLRLLFERSMLENTRSEGFTEESINESSVERGLFRSGIRMKSLVRGLVPFQERRADLISDLNPEEGAEGTQVRDIMSLIRLLQPQEARAKAGARLDSEKDELDLANLIALITSGLG